MGLRKYKRQIAREVMTTAGVGNVNKKMSKTNKDGAKIWRKALEEHAEYVRKNKERIRKAQAHKRFRKAVEA